MPRLGAIDGQMPPHTAAELDEAQSRGVMA